jgi:hypothetical protein
VYLCICLSAMRYRTAQRILSKLGGNILQLMIHCIWAIYLLCASIAHMNIHVNVCAKQLSQVCLHSSFHVFSPNLLPQIAHTSCKALETWTNRSTAYRRYTLSQLISLEFIPPTIKMCHTQICVSYCIGNKSRVGRLGLLTFFVHVGVYTQFSLDTKQMCNSLREC